ncbi:MAG: carnitine dehydratase [Candidatus Marinimicrobia bacterium]|nr:carnitine dehydratase [Candidatus Neomarinimicrobiota bacterium]
MSQFRDLCSELKIIELASVLAGPSVGAFFAEFGASVIKVENPRTSGDVTRSWRTAGEQNTSDISAYFASVNFGKRSLALDISQQQGRAVLYALLGAADVIIASYKPGDAEKLGVAYDEVKKHNPSIIYGHITGYGNDSSRAGYDAIIQAETGYTSMNGTNEMCKMPVALMDVLAGHQLKEAILMALWSREKTGSGCYIPISLYDSALSGLVNQASNFLNAGHVPKPLGSDHPNIVPYGTLYQCKDGQYLILAVGNDKQFAELMDILKLEINPKFETNHGRVQNREELKSVLADSLKSMDRDALLEKLHDASIPAGELNDMEHVFTNSAALNMVVENDGVRSVRQGAYSDKDNAIRRPPHFGEHTKTILEDELQLGEDEINSLINNNIIHHE